MCGRYTINNEALYEMQKLVTMTEPDIFSRREYDVHPADRAPVILERDGELHGEVLRWGFPGYQKTGLVINARQETLFEKRMFHDSILLRRCVIPAGGFYEWNKEKEKYTFRREKGKTMFMAGIYNKYLEEDRFVILTTKANASMERVHDRMPLLFTERQVADWILKKDSYRKLLTQTPYLLEYTTDYEQQMLDL